MNRAESQRWTPRAASLPVPLLYRITMYEGRKGKRRPGGAESGEFQGSGGRAQNMKVYMCISPGLYRTDTTCIQIYYTDTHNLHY